MFRYSLVVSFRVVYGEYREGTALFNDYVLRGM